jgi:hypothetical protein
MREPTFSEIARATIAIHAVDCDTVGCEELESTGRYAEQGYAAAFALANPEASNETVRAEARAWRESEVRRAQLRFVQSQP